MTLTIHRAHLVKILCFSLALGTLLVLPGCVDTSIPEFTRELGDGPTDGPICNPTLSNEFPPEELRITLIDVGQGDAIWVRTPYYESEELESFDILIDTGPSGFVEGTSPGGQVVVNYLLNHGMAIGELIDAVAITHAHEDHYGGLPEIVANFEIGTYADPGYTAGSAGFLAARNAATAEVERLSGVVGVPAIPNLVTRTFVQTDFFGQFIDAEVLWSAAVPPTGSPSSTDGTDVNNTSLVFALRWGGVQVLLMGDAEEFVEEELVKAHDAGEIDLTSSVLKVGHHGSANSSILGFLGRVFPRGGGAQDWAVISSGVRSFSGVTLPREETLLNLSEILLPNHILSTQNRDAEEGLVPGTEHNGDHIIITISADGIVEACYEL